MRVPTLLGLFFWARWNAFVVLALFSVLSFSSPPCCDAFISLSFSLNRSEDITYCKILAESLLVIYVWKLHPRHRLISPSIVSTIMCCSPSLRRHLRSRPSLLYYFLVIFLSITGMNPICPNMNRFLRCSSSVSNQACCGVALVVRCGK